MPLALQTYDIGCEPSPSVPGETVIQDGWATYLLFFAVSKSADDTGYLKDLGVAVVECKHCSASKFGYPNDEGRPEHPLYNLGLGAAESSVLEIVGSTWAQEVHQQQIASSQRIDGSSRERSFGWSRRKEYVRMAPSVLAATASPSGMIGRDVVGSRVPKEGRSDAYIYSSHITQYMFCRLRPG